MIPKLAPDYQLQGNKDHYRNILNKKGKLKRMKPNKQKSLHWFEFHIPKQIKKLFLIIFPKKGTKTLNNIITIRIIRLYSFRHRTIATKKPVVHKENKLSNNNRASYTWYGPKVASNTICGFDAWEALLV